MPRAGEIFRPWAFSVGHSVENVVDPDAVGERSVALGIFWAVRPFPGIANIRVMADGDHDAAAVVADGPPLWDPAVRSVLPAAPNKSCAGNLEALVKIVHDVENLVCVLQIFHSAVRKNHKHTAHKIIPLVVAMGIVNHHESAF